MKNLFERHKDLKESIGSFILAFSQMEYGLGILCTFTEFDLLRRDEHLPDYLGMTLDNKRRTITNYLSKYEKELLTTWKELDSEIDFLNRQRRFIAHGIQHVFVDDKLYAAVRIGKKIQEKDLRIDEVNKWTNRLHHVNTGKHGILGEFYGEFVTRSINRWNKHVIEEFRIVYKVNSKIVSDWKGSE
jgi:hypothetical protein